MEWPSLSRVLDVLEGIDPKYQIIAAAGIVLVLLLLLAVLRTHRRRVASAEQASRYAATREIKDVKLLAKDLEETLSVYRKSHPLFYQFVKSYQEKHSIDDLFENEEVEIAFGKLAFHKDRKKKMKGRETALGLENVLDEDRVTRAAMITILRALYSDPGFRGRLTPADEAQFDRLLDSLTE